MLEKYSKKKEEGYKKHLLLIIVKLLLNLLRREMVIKWNVRIIKEGLDKIRGIGQRDYLKVV